MFSSWRHGQKAPEPMARLAFSPTATAVSRALSGFRSILPRARARAMIVHDGAVRKLNLEAAPGKVETSSAETLLKQL
jgi:peroxiredoxin